VRAQLRIAAGEPLAAAGRAPRRGHAIEIRLNAEDAARDFLPTPGRVERFRAPLGPGVRVDTYVEDGTKIPPHYDSLIAKVVVWDSDRAAALARAERALAETEVDGVPTTRDVALAVLRSDEFASGEYSTSTLANLGAAVG
jgi:acetyl/propionyl-CoA carboxylase alpha subunit